MYALLRSQSDLTADMGLRTCLFLSFLGFCRYIVAASKCQQFGVVEQMTRESTHLDVDKVVGFLMDAKLADARPLINVCDRFDRVTELTKFLYENNLLRYIEGCAADLFNV